MTETYSLLVLENSSNAHTGGPRLSYSFVDLQLFSMEFKSIFSFQTPDGLEKQMSGRTCGRD